MTPRITYVLVFFTAVAIRLFMNFRYDLIPGVNGGYYPLQVRSVLTNGYLAFSDMPLYFYLNAIVAKVVSVFSEADINSIVMSVVKTVDSVFLPLLLIPLHGLSRQTGTRRLPLYQDAAIGLFAASSMSPLIFTSGLQKNGFAIPFVFAFILFATRFLYHRRKLDLFWASLFFAFIGLSHFGAFSLAAFLLILGLLVYRGRKALVPILTTIIFTLTLTAVFDTTRAHRLLAMFSELFSPPLNNFGPRDLPVYLLSFALVGVGVFHLIRSRRYEINSNDMILLGASTIASIILSFPFLNIEYARRLTLMLFIPQTIMLLVLFKIGGSTVRTSLTVIIGILLLVLSPTVVEFNKPVMTQEAYADLSHLKEEIGDPDNTLVIARHGLEWWVAWALQTKIAQEKAVDDATIFHKYSRVIVLSQKKGMNGLQPGKNIRFSEPLVPPAKRLIYRSEYFVAYEWTNQ